MPTPAGLEHARAMLEAGGAVPASSLAPEVARSWERCLAAGLDPGDRPRNVVVAFSDVKARREQAALLRRLALAQMQLLHEQIAGSDFMVAFADAEGVVLDTRCDHRFSESEAGRTILPGSVWREEGRGTNALGLALVEQAPVAIYGREHFFCCHGHLSCMAVPVFDPSDRLAGLLDASSPNETRQQHTLALVRMAAAAIENGLMTQDRPDLLLLALHPRAEYLDTLSAGLAALDADGAVVALNRPARALLAGLDTAPGRAFGALFEASFGAVMDELAASGIARIRDRAGSMVYLMCRRLAARPLRPAVDKTPVPAVTPPVAARLPETSADFICSDPVLGRRMKGLDVAARNRLAVHIHGETGTGKELMARHVHALSGRSGAFVAVNCGALPESLFIAELFGHERGAYTSARNEGAAGLVRQADGGTLFLDEVADIPLPAQTALLRFLDSMEVRAVGGARAVKVDVQIVSATNRNLAKAVANGQFRADLLFRLNSFPIELPPLRERADFADIVRHLLARQPGAPALSEATIARLSRRSWHGNIRELAAALWRLAIIGEDEALEMQAGEPGEGLPDQEVCAHCAGTRLTRSKCREIREAYARCDGNIQAAARQLGISRTTVYKHLPVAAAARQR
ncbi:sigma-54-dependent Fis family transcriptional regulator [Ancylobacter terrae]|uniref:sigma-54-dependent Fis family transcriptional regulator n=1 Tax=Ancylobacter sp. sgz301288 TaxID=3342077 RepID=UPI00385DC749